MVLLSRKQKMGILKLNCVGYTTPTSFDHIWWSSSRKLQHEFSVLIMLYFSLYLTFSLTPILKSQKIQPAYIWLFGSFLNLFNTSVKTKLSKYLPSRSGDLLR